ncbi:MAG: glycosyltransferase family 4 protein [Desulfuromonadales bacterium]
MRVVQLLPELNEGGVERGVVELSRELVRRGIESMVISAGGKQAARIEADGGRHIYFDAASKNLFSAPARISRLRQLLQELNPDIIHARSRVPAWLAYLANRKQRRPFVTTVHGFNSVNRYSRVMTCGDRVICVSGAIRDYVVEHYHLPPEKLIVIPRGIDLEQFNPAQLNESFMSEFSERFDLAGKFVVSTVGRITQLKDYETFISALHVLQKQRPDLVGLIVGGVREDKQGYFQRLKAQVAGLHAGAYIHFTGSQSNVAEIYAMSDVVVSSSKKPESFGRSAAEALAMQVPVAASGQGGMLDIVLPGRTGQLFEPGDIQGLAQAIEDCQNLPRKTLRDFVRANFSLEQMVDKTMAVYRELISDE